MELFHSIILGLIQGLTEFLPISSSGHLVILPRLLNWGKHSLSFDIILHAGSLCAIIIYFRREWINMFRGRLWWYLILATTPAVIFGGLTVGIVERHFRDPFIAAFLIGAFGLVLYGADVRGGKKRSLADMTWRTCLVIGAAQMLAVFPGVSRSGVTISAALLLGIDRESSVRFSFLMGAPILFAALCYNIAGSAEIRHFFSDPALPAGFLAAFICSMAAIHFLLGYVRRKPFTVFVIYRLLAAAVIPVLLFFRG